MYESLVENPLHFKKCKSRFAADKSNFRLTLWELFVYKGLPTSICTASSQISNAGLDTWY